MPKEQKNIDAGFLDGEVPRWTANLLAEEDEFDRRTLWRLGSWATAAVGLLVVALLAARYAGELRGERTAFAALAAQTQTVRATLKMSEGEARRLAAALDTLNSDRDRLYTRVTVLEQELESVTASITRDHAVKPTLIWPVAVAAPVLTAPFSSPTTDDLMAALRSDTAGDRQVAIGSEPAAAEGPTVTGSLGPLPAREVHDLKILAKVVTPESPAAKPTRPDIRSDAETNPKIDKVESTRSDDGPATTAAISLPPGAGQAGAATPARPVQRTTFGVDLGGADSVEGLRTLWRDVLQSQNAVLGALQPIIVIKEPGDSSGLQLRLVAGPLDDAAVAATICARLIEGKRSCEASIFDGQRLALNVEKPTAVERPDNAEKPGAVEKPNTVEKPLAVKIPGEAEAPAEVAVKHPKRRPRRVAAEEPPPPPKPKPTGLNALFSGFAGFGSSRDP